MTEYQLHLRDLIVRCWDLPQSNDPRRIHQWQEDVHELLTVHCYDNPALFHVAVLGRQPFHDYQHEMCDLVVNNDVTVIASGNSLGKTFWSASIALWYLYTRRNSIVTTTSSSFSQLTRALWKNIREARDKSRIPLGGKITAPRAVPQQIKIDNEWLLEGVATVACEKMAGQHAASGKHLVLCDEASGIGEQVYHGVTSLSADKYVWVGNPLIAEGPFFDLWRIAERGEKGYGCLKIPCHRSPDIDRWKSDRGLACQSFLAQKRAEFGENSQYWLSHILAEFPTETSESLIPRSWLDLAEAAEHVPSGVRRLAIDLALGGGGDYTVILVRDDNGILHIERSNKWKFDDTARKVDELMRQFNVQPQHVIYDANGPGHDFSNRLMGYGIRGVIEFVGSRGTGTFSRYADHRTAAAFALKRRLNPDRVSALPQPGEPPALVQQFAIPKRYMDMGLRNQLLALSVRNADENKVRLRAKAEIKTRLGCSPDLADALAMSMFMR